MALGDLIQANASNGTTGTSPTVTLAGAAAANSLLIAVLSIRCDTPITSVTGLTSGYSLVAQSLGIKAACVVAWKKAAGGETTFACTINGTPVNQSLTLAEIDATGIDLTQIHAYADNKTFVNYSGVKEVQTGTATMSATAGLAVGILGTFAIGNWNDTLSWGQSFVAKTLSLL